MTALFLREAEVASLVAWSEANAVVEKALVAHAAGESAHNRTRQRVPAGNGVLNVLSGGCAATGLVGLKSYALGFDRRTPHALVLLYSCETGDLAAVLEGNHLSDLRTGALSTAGVRMLARPGPLRVGVFGSGRQARAALRSLAASRKLAGVTVYSRSAERVARFCDEMAAGLGLPVRPARAPEEAAKEVDVIITATTASEPVLFSTWVGGGTHISAVGANSAQRSELDSGLVQQAAVIAVDDPEQARVDAGDLLALGSRLDWQRVYHIGDIMRGKIPVNRRPDDVTLFEAVGVAVADVAVGALAYRKALDAGVGTVLPL